MPAEGKRQRQKVQNSYSAVILNNVDPVRNIAAGPMVPMKNLASAGMIGRHAPSMIAQIVRTARNINFHLP